MPLLGFGVTLNPEPIKNLTLQGFYFKHSKFFLGHGPSAVVYHALRNFFYKNKVYKNGKSKIVMKT